MLHILLLILKIIGIILLVILGILVLSLCLVLFAPAYYQVRAKTDDGVSQLAFRVNAHWFLHLVSAFVDYKEKQFDWQFRIAWKKFNEPKKEADSETAEEMDEAAEDKREGTAEETIVENVDTPDEHTGVKHTTEKTDENKSRESKQRSVESKKIAKKKQTWFEKIKCTILKICDKIKELWKMKEKVTDFLTDEIHKSAFQRVKNEVFTLAKRLSPRTLKGYVRFGFEDPYNTGRVLAGLSILYPFYGEKISIYPEFEKEILEGDIYMKGHIRGIHLLMIVFHLLFDRNIRKTYQDFKSLK